MRTSGSQFSTTGLAAARPALSAVEMRAGLFLLSVFVLGCSSNSSTTQPAGFTDRQQAALKDPMGYKVPANPDISDGTTTGLDKPGLQRDMDDVLNP